jgi:hypothetical protein
VAPKDCTDEQRRELCAENGRRMLQLCVPLALEKSSEIKVTVPEQLAGLKASAATLRDHANKLREKKEETNDDGAEKSSGKTGIGGFMDKMTNALDSAAEKAGELVGKGIGAALDEAANALDTAVGKVEDPMSKVGKDIVEEKKAEIAKAYAEVIPVVCKDADVPISLVRGSPPYKQAEYDAVPGSALSDQLTKLARDKLAEQLQDVVKPAVEEHAALKAFASAMKAHDAAVAASAKLTPSGSKPLEKAAEFDLCKHVVQEVISQLGVLMGKEEAAIRKAPEGKLKGKEEVGEDPRIFAIVFSGQQLTAETWAGTFKHRHGLK